MPTEGGRRSLTLVYVWGVIILGIGVFALTVLNYEPLGIRFTQSWDGILAFFALGVFLQLAQHRLAVGPATGSIAFIVYLGSLLVFGPAIGAIVTASSYASASLLERKQPLRIAFNVAQHVLAVVGGFIVYASLAGEVPIPSMEESVVPFAGLVMTFFTINSTAVSAVVALSEQRRFGEVWIRNTWSWAGYDLVASMLALGIAWLYLRLGVGGMAIVVLPILFLRHAYLINTQLQARNRELLELMVKAIEARDPYTSGHSERVAQIARILAQEMGLSLSEMDKIETAALLHDVGKIYEEFAPILRKETKLTADERRTMESHPVKSAQLVATISNLRGYVEKCVRHHHENFDGSGYPSGLAGDQIPIGARIILVADTADAMTTDRPYRRALSYTQLLIELEKYSGKQFDPAVVSAFKKSSTIRRLLVGLQQPSGLADESRGQRVAGLVEQ